VRPKNVIEKANDVIQNQLSREEAAALYKILRETSLPADGYALVKGAIRRLAKLAEAE
jgi:hypothetical protein